MDVGTARAIRLSPLCALKQWDEVCTKYDQFGDHGC